jgi:hypothetical protein
MSRIHDVLARLPERCYVFLPEEGRIGIILLGGRGYRPYPIGPQTPERAMAMNADLGVTLPQVSAMTAGCQAGWDSPIVGDLLDAGTAPEPVPETAEPVAPPEPIKDLLDE